MNQNEALQKIVELAGLNRDLLQSNIATVESLIKLAENPEAPTREEVLQLLKEMLGATNVGWEKLSKALENIEIHNE